MTRKEALKVLRQARDIYESWTTALDDPDDFHSPAIFIPYSVMTGRGADRIIAVRQHSFDLYYAMIMASRRTTTGLWGITEIHRHGQPGIVKMRWAIRQAIQILHEGRFNPIV